MPGLCKYAGIALERARSLKEIKLAATIVETGIGIAYRDDPKAAIEAITAPMKKLDFVSEKPNLQIGIERFADSAIVIGVRAWVPTTSYSEARYKVNLAVLEAVNQAGLSIPFPQLDIHRVDA